MKTEGCTCSQTRRTFALRLPSLQALKPGFCCSFSLASAQLLVSQLSPFPLSLLSMVRVELLVFSPKLWLLSLLILLVSWVLEVMALPPQGFHRVHHRPQGHQDLLSPWQRR